MGFDTKMVIHDLDDLGLPPLETRSRNQRVGPKSYYHVFNHLPKPKKIKKNWSPEIKGWLEFMLKAYSKWVGSKTKHNQT